VSRTQTSSIDPTPDRSRRPRLTRSLVALLAVLIVPPLLLLVGTGAEAAGPAPVSLGRAEGYLVLGASTVTNTGPTVVGGSLGLSPGTSVTGFPPGTLSSGSIDAGSTAAASAQTDFGDALTRAGQRDADHLIDTELGGQVLQPGVHADEANGALTLNGEVTLDAGGDQGAVFIIRTDTTLTTAAASSVRLVNGAQGCRVYWLVGSSATLGAASNLSGNLMAQTSITVGDDVGIRGRLLAHDAAITLHNDAITAPTCEVEAPTTTAPPTAATTTATTTSPTTSPGPVACDTGGRPTTEAFGQPLPPRAVPDRPTVQGQVTSRTTGRPIPYATVRLLRASDGTAVTSSAQADPDGRYAFATTGSGPFVVQYVAFGYTTTTSSPFTLNGPTVTRDGALDLAAATPGAQGTVVDATTGRPLDGVAVRLWQQPNLYAYTATTTANGGQYRFTNVPAGTYVVQFAGPGYATVWHSAATTRGTASPIDITPAGATTINASLVGRCADVRPVR
jgi:hypothetical protein